MLRATVVLTTLVFLAGLAFAQGLPDPFLGEVPPPPEPTEGDPQVQEEFLPPPGVPGEALQTYPLAPMLITFANDAPLIEYNPVPGLNLDLTVAAPRPEPEPEPEPVLAVEPEVEEVDEEQERASRLDRLLQGIPRVELPAGEPLEAAQIAGEKQLPNFALLGIVTGARPIAVVEVDGYVHRLNIGDEMPSSSFILEDIEPLQVVLSGGGDTVTVPLE